MPIRQGSSIEHLVRGAVGGSSVGARHASPLRGPWQGQTAENAIEPLHGGPILQSPEHVAHEFSSNLAFPNEIYRTPPAEQGMLAIKKIPRCVFGLPDPDGLRPDGSESCFDDTLSHGFLKASSGGPIGKHQSRISLKSSIRATNSLTA